MTSQSTSSGRHRGHVAIVTGAGSGVGRATATQLAAEGASVVVADIDLAAGERVAAAIRDAGNTAVARAVDVSDQGAVAAMVEFAVAQFGGLDILHNNAAALGRDVYGRDVAVADLDLEVWDRTLAVNLRGVLLGCKYAVRAMRPRGGGAIVNTASVGAMHGGDDHSAYGVSKAGIVSLTRYVASMYGPDRIRCNAVAPGLILSETAKEALTDHQLAEFEVERALPWAAEPEDIANVVCWLASDDARCITGETVVADSGILARRPRDSMAAWERYLSAQS
jgi:NAD(P)-dependent dehydrogenase (short-subunit alcohol dehydrogenase family)